MEVNSEVKKEISMRSGTRSQIRVGLRGNGGEKEEIYKNIFQIVLFYTHFHYLFFSHQIYEIDNLTTLILQMKKLRIRESNLPKVTTQLLNARVGI